MMLFIGNVSSGVNELGRLSDNINIVVIILVMVLVAEFSGRVSALGNVWLISIVINNVIKY